MSTFAEPVLESSWSCTAILLPTSSSLKTINKTINTRTVLKAEIPVIFWSKNIKYFGLCQVSVHLKKSCLLTETSHPVWYNYMKWVKEFMLILLILF